MGFYSEFYIPPALPGAMDNKREREVITFQMVKKKNVLYSGLMGKSLGTPKLAHHLEPFCPLVSWYNSAY